MNLFALAVFLAFVPALAAQTVPLQLWDHVVGDEILHNKTLPAQTQVWIVTRDEARAVRLRDGYGEIIAGLPTATRDRLGPGGRTMNTYPRTARAGKGYYVLAQLPDGRLFQSYVKTGDAGMQPGFDDVQTGRISMGLVPERAASQLRPVLTGTPPEVPSTNDAAEGAVEPEASTPGDVSLPAFEPAPLPDTLEPTPVPLAEAMDEPAQVLPSAVSMASRGTSRGWLWLLGGLLVGGAGAYLGTAGYYERLLRRQRANMLRYVPAPEPAEEELPASDDALPFLPATAAILSHMGALPEPEDEDGEDREDGGDAANDPRRPPAHDPA